MLAASLGVSMRLCCLLVLLPLFGSAQMDRGEVRLTVTDATGLALPSSGTLVSQASQTHRTFETAPDGHFTFQSLPFGFYRISVEHAGFAPASTLFEVRSPVPAEMQIVMKVQAAPTEVVVTDAATLLDPHRTGVVYSMGTQQIRELQPANPSRSLPELVNMQPGWLMESNAVLHPRGSEYQTLMVVDGIQMDENRSPAFAPQMEGAGIQELSILTGNFPAEYGRKLGGVVEVTTGQDIRQGLHGSAGFGGGSFGMASGFVSGTYGWNGRAFTLSASGDHTDRYLDPAVLGNFTNTGNSHGMAAAYDDDPSDSDHIHLYFTRQQMLFQVPNENLQQEAGQRQDRNSREDLAQAAWTHEFSPQLLLNVRAAFEDLSGDLWSNALSTPIIAFQQQGFRRSFLSSTLAAHKGRHDIKFGGDAFYAPVSEALQYHITDPSYFDPGTPADFRFSDHRPDREQSLFAQDTMRFGNLTLSAGLRWDHYSFVVRDNAWSPRLGAAWYWPKAELVFHISYDRAFLTPARENLLLASSAQVDSVNPEVLRLPVLPSRGNFWEAGFSKGMFSKLRLDTTFYRRTFDNYADDDVFLNTGISFPIAFHNAEIRGVDVKLELPRWGNLSGFLSYSNMLGVAQLPVTGGLFLGDNSQGVLGGTDQFPVSQDQRNTARGRVRYQIHPRVWVSATALYGSGLPVETDTGIDSLTAQYGQRIIDRVNFSAGRTRPNFSLDAALGADLWKRDQAGLRLQVEGENLTNQLNVINFAGLFSGTAIAPPRSASMRLQFEF
jgi:hypothetical protein